MARSSSKSCGAGSNHSCVLKAIAVVVAITVIAMMIDDHRCDSDSNCNIIEVIVSKGQ